MSVHNAGEAKSAKEETRVSYSSRQARLGLLSCTKHARRCRCAI